MSDAGPGAAIRRLGPDDGAALRALNALFAEVFEDAASYAAAPPDDAYLRRLLSNDGNIVVVAERAGAIVGGAVAYRMDKFEQMRCEVYIYDLAVAETARRCGVATALIAEVCRIARAAGAWVVSVQADYGDAPAIALYTKLGAREEVLHFDIAVDGQA